MSRLKLEEFELQPLQPELPSPSPAEMRGSVFSEEAKLEAFENGYKAGWDDAARSHAENLDNVSVELGRNLQDLSFTYYEARSQILKDMRTVFMELVSKVLPRMAMQSLPALIAEQIAEIANAQVVTRIELRIHPSNLQVVGGLVASQTHLDVTVVGEESLGEGQARLVFAEGEQDIDLSSVLTSALEKTEGFFDMNEKVG